MRTSMIVGCRTVTVHWWLLLYVPVGEASVKQVPSAFTAQSPDTEKKAVFDVVGGEVVGDSVGGSVGEGVGEAVGAPVGESVGGEVVGESVGGEVVGDSVGGSVGEAKGAGVGDGLAGAVRQISKPALVME
jgi:hypothetical protein